jgi:hypothetical protein
MRRELIHPRKPRTSAVIGFDPAMRGWFAEVTVTGRKHDRTRVVESYGGGGTVKPASVEGALELLVRHGFITADDFTDAVRRLGHDLPGDVDGREAAEVFASLRLAARTSADDHETTRLHPIAEQSMINARNHAGTHGG